MGAVGGWSINVAGINGGRRWVSVNQVVDMAGIDVVGVDRLGWDSAAGGEGLILVQVPGYYKLIQN